MIKIKKQGFASFSLAKRKRIAKKGGSSPHKLRGFQAISKEKLHTITSLGGLARTGRLTEKERVRRMKKYKKKPGKE